MREAVRRGVPVEGVCLYPVLSHPGWDDERYCANGLFEMEPHHDDRRPVHAPLAAELRHQQGLFAVLFEEQDGKDRAEKAGGPRAGLPRQPARTVPAGPEQRGP